MTTQFVFFLFLFLNAQNTIGQERITAIQSERTNARFYAAEDEGIDYLLEIKQDDKLYVQKIDNDFSISPMHSRTFKGIFENDPMIIKGDFIYTFDDTSPVIYDYKNDDVSYINIPSAYFGHSWVSIGEMYSVVRADGPVEGVYMYFLVDRNGEVLTEDDKYKYTVEVNGDYLLINSWNGTEKSTFLEDIVSGEEIELVSDLQRFNYKYLDGELIFGDVTGRFVRYNPETGEKVDISDIEFDQNRVGSINVIDNTLFVAHSELGSSAKIYMIDISTGILKNEFTNEGLAYFNLDNSFVVNNKLIVKAQEAILIFRLNQGFATRIETNFNTSNIPLIEDRYLFYTRGNQSYLYDTNWFSEIELNGEHDISYQEFSSITKLGNDYLGVFNSGKTYKKSVFKLDVEEKSLTHLDWIDDSNYGIDLQNLELTELNKKLVLVANDLYEISGNEASIINPYEALDVKRNTYGVQNYHLSPFKIYGDKVTFFCRNDLNEIVFYNYDGNQLNEEIVFPFTNPFLIDVSEIRDYRITEDHLFYIHKKGNNIHLTSRDKVTGVEKNLYDLVYVNFGGALYQVGDVVYFADKDHLYIIENGEELKRIHSFEGCESYDRSLIINDDKLYLIGDNEISILNGDKLISILTGDFTHASYPFGDQLETESFMLHFGGEFNSKNAVYIEGDQAYIYEFEDKVSYIFKSAKDYFLIDTEVEEFVGERKFVFKRNTQDIFEVTDVDPNGYIFDVFLKSDDVHILSVNEKTKKVLVHQMEEDFMSPNQVYATDVYRYGYRGDFIENGEYGVSYFAEEIGVIKDDFPVKKLNVKGNSAYAELHLADNGYVYFIANDIEYGNQLFRVNPETFFLNTSLSSFEANTLNVFPNPASEVIRLDAGLNDQKYSILDSQGKLVQKGSINQPGINVVQLSSGIYFVHSSKNGTPYLGKFVKQ